MTLEYQSGLKVSQLRDVFLGLRIKLFVAFPIPKVRSQENTKRGWLSGHLFSGPMQVQSEKAAGVLSPALPRTLAAA